MKLLYMVFFILILPFIISAQVIVIPYDINSVNVDGQLGTNEWMYHKDITIQVSTTDSIVVWCKHDMSNLYFAFAGKLESGGTGGFALFPEVLLDPAYVRSSSWQAGEWWFHVSATDCESNGAYGVYTNCAAMQPDWLGVPNFMPGPPNTDTVEIKIPFSKIGFNPATQDTMGLSVLGSNTATLWKLWPSSADTGKPDTWSTAIISKVPAAITQQSVYNREIIPEIYPNPASDHILIKGIKTGTTYQLRDINGKLIYKGCAKDNWHRMDINNIPEGIYTVELSYKDEQYINKILIRK